MTEQKPREFWIQGGQYSSKPDYVRETPEPDLIHVIEKKAYDDVYAKLLALNQDSNIEIGHLQSQLTRANEMIAELEKALEWMRDNTEPFTCGVGENFKSSLQVCNEAHAKLKEWRGK